MTCSYRQEPFQEFGFTLDLLEERGVGALREEVTPAVGGGAHLEAVAAGREGELADRRQRGAVDQHLG